MPKELLNKLNISSAYLATSLDETIEVGIISGDTVENISRSVDNLGGKYEDLGYNFGIVVIPVDKIRELALLPQIQYIEFPKDLYITDESGNRASCVPQAISSYDIYGEGTLIGFIDTGIDYTHPAFINEDGTTRIEYIYDLDQSGEVYNKQQINEALKSPNPFSIVNSMDITGHGTHVAGIACAGGKINKRYYGVAPKSSIAMVKVARTQFGLSNEIMRGIKFLVDKSKELDMPLVINMSLSTNDGAHNGTSLFEQYISIIASLEKITMVVSAGNEGEADHHIGGEIDGTKEIYFNVASDESIISINLYKSLLPKISIEVTCPCGDTTGEIVIEQGLRSGVMMDSRYVIYYTGPTPFDISGQIGIILTASNQYISSGQWKITLRRINEYIGTFDMWLPISERLNVTTKFLRPTIYNTLGIPATVKNIISVGSYDSVTGDISPFSGRGKNYEGQYIKPDFVAPGEGIYSSIPNKGFATKTGTSMAAPNVSGICALMMEWGVIKENDPYLYGERIKYYLSLGAKRERQDVIYPDPAWGYGQVCMYRSLQNILEVLGNRNNLIVRQQQQNPSTTSQDSDDERNFYLVEARSLNEFNEVLKIPGVTGTLISETFALVLTLEKNLSDIEKYVNRIIDYNIGGLYTASEISPLEAAEIVNITSNPYLRLNGRGVLVGIIDSGVDYLSKEFQREDDTSRIFRLWDQTLKPDEFVLDIEYGKEYTEEDITKAIELKNSGGDPYTIVPSKDDIGHGTMVSGIIGGRGVNPDLKGAAPDCEFVVVKLSQATNKDLADTYITPKVPTYSPWNILLAIKYVSTIANNYNRPIAIYIPLQNNMGSHMGNSILESIISNLATQVGTLFITNAGNQGNSETHTQGKIDLQGEFRDIELRVGKNQRILPIQIWINQPNIVSLSIISPSGEIQENFTSKNSIDKNIKFTYEQTEMNINFVDPDFTTGDSIIFIRIKNLKEGIWKFRLTGKFVVDCSYYAWIPQRELLDSETKFLNPIADMTITLPSTSRSGISVAYYDQNRDSIIAESGKGFTRDGTIKPDIAAGGVNALVIAPNGGTKIVSGASVAGAVVAGGCALILQWAIVDGNQKNLREIQVRSYIRGGAKTRQGDVYPNREWGYGMFSLKGVFDTITEIYSESNTRSIEDDYEEYTVGSLYIRKPRKM